MGERKEEKVERNVLSPIISVCVPSHVPPLAHLRESLAYFHAVLNENDISLILLGILSDPRKRSRSSILKFSSQREVSSRFRYFYSTFIFTGGIFSLFNVQKPKGQQWPSDVGKRCLMRHFRYSHCCQYSLSSTSSHSTSAKTEAQVQKIIIKLHEYCEPNEVCEPRAQIIIIRNTNKSNKGASKYKSYASIQSTSIATYFKYLLWTPRVLVSHNNLLDDFYLIQIAIQFDFQLEWKIKYPTVSVCHCSVAGIVDRYPVFRRYWRALVHNHYNSSCFMQFTRDISSFLAYFPSSNSLFFFGSVPLFVRSSFLFLTLIRILHDNIPSTLMKDKKESRFWQAR